MIRFIILAFGITLLVSVTADAQTSCRTTCYSDGRGGQTCNTNCW